MGSNQFTEFDDINTQEWEDAMGDAIQENLDLTPIEDLQNDILETTKTVYDVVNAVGKVINGFDS